MSELNKEEKMEKIRKLKKDDWIEAWFAIEAMGMNKEIVTEALGEHIQRMAKVKDIFIFEKAFKEVHKVEGLEKGKEAYSQIVELKLLIKNMFSFFSVVILYGPSSIEIIDPPEIRIKIDEAQNIVNMIAGVIHQFAAAGVGGMIFIPKEK